MRTMYEKLKKILDSQGKVNRQVSRALTGTPQVTTVTSPPPQSSQPVQSVVSPTSNNLVSPQPFPPKHSVPISLKHKALFRQNQQLLFRKANGSS